MSKAVIIGGGIIGLSSAKYLSEAGWDVTVLDQGDFLDNCSYGNAGFVCPSHYIQLATPQVVKQGLVWMLNSTSPFYIQPRLSSSLVKWGLSFLKSATKKNIVKNGIPLRDIGLLSKSEYEQKWLKDLSFSYGNKGMLEIFKTEISKQECAETVAFGRKLGLDVELVDHERLRELEPQTQIDALGAIHYHCDGYLYPNELMASLITYLENRGVRLVRNTEVLSASLKGKAIQELKTSGGASFSADAFVLAAGAWSGGLAKSMGLTLPVVGGRGYSFTLPVSVSFYGLKHSGILVEGRCAFTPMGSQHVRFGGTMEITNLSTPPRYKRVQGILSAVHDFFPEIDLSLDQIKDKVWFGFRPVSGDGMPYIGKSKNVQNLIVATGHSQLGVSLGSATGLLVSELLEGKQPSVDLSAFSPDRFS